jgi:hypothetical protein
MCYRKETNRRAEWASRERGRLAVHMTPITALRLVLDRLTLTFIRNVCLPVHRPFSQGRQYSRGQVAGDTVVRVKAHMQRRGSALSRKSPCLRATRGWPTVILSTGDFTQTVEHVKALIAYDVSAVAWGLVADVTVARVKGATWRAHPRGLECV